MVYYIAAVVLFVIVGYIIHKIVYNRFKRLNGRKPTRRELLSVYHWDFVIGISAVVVITVVYFIKSSKVLPF